MGEDSFLEMEYEDRNGGLVSTSHEDDLDYGDDYDYQYAGPENRDTHW